MSGKAVDEMLANCLHPLFFKGHDPTYALSGERAMQTHALIVSLFEMIFHQVS